MCIFIASAACSFPSAAAASISLQSCVTPDNAKIPDSLFNIRSISSGVKPSFFIINVTTDGSISPERVPIGMPASGVSPILVSTDLPPWTAHILPPWPKWQDIILKSSIGFPSNSATRLATYWWDVPWKPYFLTPYSL